MQNFHIYTKRLGENKWTIYGTETTETAKQAAQGVATTLQTMREATGEHGYGFAKGSQVAAVPADALLCNSRAERIEKHGEIVLVE
jgi:hypothetical protein